MKTFKELKENVSQIVGGVKFACTEYSPDIHMVIGGGLIIAGAVAVGFATKKALGIKDKEDDFIAEEVEKMAGPAVTVETANGEVDENGEVVCSSEDVIDISPEEYKLAEKKAKRRVKTRMVFCYALPTGLIVTGMFVSGRGYVILKDRLFQTSMAFNALQAWVAGYQRRVEAVVGKEKNEELKHGIGAKYTGTQDEDGTDIIEVSVDDSALVGPFIYEFSEDTSSEYDENNEDYNDMTIQLKADRLQQMLNYRGHLFANECFDMFGMARTDEGAVLGYKGPGKVIVTAKKVPWDVNCEVPYRKAPRYMLEFNFDGLIFGKLNDSPTLYLGA